ncbi:terminal uridylyltransferase 7 [Sardina pilchardus]|uniref:terminal uridylyltransferase 7 n=1 Tax=Sardina pilchardus TaxID=27697 RepID=UPI002E0F24AB
MEGFGRGMRSQRGRGADEAENWRSPRKEGGFEMGFSPGGFSPGGRRGGGGWAPGMSPKQRGVPQGSPRRPEENWRDREYPPETGQSRSKRRHPSGEKHGGRGSGLHWRDRGTREMDRVLVIDHTTNSISDLLQTISQPLDETQGRTEESVWFSCHLCDTKMDSVSRAHSHLRDRGHRRRAKEKRDELMLKSIPPPGKDQTSAIGSALEGVMVAEGLSEEDVLVRSGVLALMQSVITPVLPGSKLRLYGSSCTRFGFKDSDVNIDIQASSSMHQPDVLLLVQETLSKCSEFVEVQGDFHTRVPVVVCREKQSALLCRVSAGNDSACLTTQFLSALASQEPHLLPLVLGLRHWAKICHVDCVEEGGVPPYSLALMVICFLQQRKEPLLPACLESTGFSVGQLAGFSLTALEDDEVLWVYSPPQTDTQVPNESTVKRGKVPLVFGESSSEVGVGLLWVELLRFYALDFQLQDRVLSVRTSAPLWRDNKDWPRKRIAIEDPFAVGRNIARTMISQPMFDYFLHCLKTTYKYFSLRPAHPAANHKPRSQPSPKESSTPRKASGEAKPKACRELNHVQSGVRNLRETSKGSSRRRQNSNCLAQEEPEEDEESSDLLEEDESEEEDDSEEEEVMNREEKRWEPFQVTAEEEGLFALDEELSEEHPSDSEREEEVEEEEEDTLLSEEESPADSTPLSRPHSFTPSKYGSAEKSAEALLNGLHYHFTKQAFTLGKKPTLVCSLCKRDGHLKADCPEDFKKVEMKDLPAMTPKFLKIVDQVCDQCYKDFAPDEVEEQVREHILQDLETFIRRHIEGAHLKLFGSSKNGFGFKQSDLDICMVLEGQDTAMGLDCIGIILSLARALGKHSGLKNIIPIITAKVPIVKFCHVKTGLEGDISLYNRLGLHNTELLASYASIDPRVRQLCYTMKVFTKVCDIGDASRGSLSSYAYTLMVLFYLQQREPPVIPVLQEIYEGKTKPEVLVEGWNVYFFRDLKDLPRRWPSYGQNHESVGELWLGLLRFYTEQFDFKERVICVRQKDTLSPFQKQWTSKYITIEDPFDLHHNLGGGLSRRMINFIMKAFINGRRVFGTPTKAFPPEYPDKMEFFFDPEVLTEGEVAPNDRCCRICGKIGHFVKDCPMRKKTRNRRVSNDWEHNDRHMKEYDRLRKQEQKRCFICGANTHVKKACPYYKPGGVKPEGGSFSSSPSSTNQIRVVPREREKQSSPQLEGKKKKKKRPKNNLTVVLGPQAGSLASRHVSLTQKKNPTD